MKDICLHGQQGDVLLFQVDELPSDAKLVQKNTKTRTGGKIILALGEATGHHHYIEDDDSAVAVLESGSGDLFLQVKKDTTLIHQTHGPVPLKEGQTIRVGHVVEVDPFEKAIRRVQD